jgi:signal transduction histidine kinase/CheY-like chemotaxis protein
MPVGPNRRFAGQRIVARACWGWALFFLALLVAHPGLAQPPVLRLTDGQDRYQLAPYVACLVDSGQQIAPTDVINGRHDAAFGPPSNPRLNFGFSLATYWLRCQVQDLATQPSRRWLLELEYPNMDLVEMYLVDSLGRYEVRRAGDLLPLSLRELKQYNFAFRLPTPATGKIQILYLRFAGRDVKHFPVYITEEELFIKRLIAENSFWGFYFGMFAILFFYNLALFVYLRERLYAYYLLYLASFIFTELARANGSYGHQYLWPNNLWFANHSIHFFTSFTVVLGMLFFSQGLNVKQTFPIFYRIMQLTACLALLHVGAIVADLEPLPVVGTFALALGADVLLLLAGLITWWKGYRPARLFVLALGGMFLGISSLFMLEQGWLPDWWIFQNGLNLGSFFETLVLSLALGQSLRATKAARSQAELEQKQAQIALENSRLLAAKLQELDQLKSRFFANISHEFRTPLTVILAPLEQWLASRELPAVPWATLESIRQNAHRLLDLINQLLDLSRLEAGLMALRPQAGDLAALARVQVSQYQALAESQQIALVFEADCPTLPYQLDRDALAKILANLIGNALKFTPAGGHVWVRLQAPATGPVLSVADDGPGIAPEALPKVFDRFYQVNDAHQLAQAGSGIGLALAKELAQLMGGQLTVSSQLGQGSCFTLHLPAAPAPASRPSPPNLAPDQHVEPIVAPLPLAVAPGAEPSAGLPLVLVVEDHADLRHYLASELGQHYQVLTAPDGQAGLTLAQAKIPDLVLSDLMMPQMDGLQLCQQLKTDERTSHIPVLLLTARASLDSKLEGLGHGADDYLVKPFHPSELLARVANLLAQRLRLREHYRRDVSLLAPAAKLPSLEAQFLQKLHDKIEAMMDDADLGVEHLCDAVSLSRSQLHRKLQAITGQSATEFIRSARLRRAAHLLAQKQGNVSEIAYSVGFDNLSYFSRSFKEQYGVPPSEYGG